MRTIAVIGAGIMGHGLALVFALGGHRVRITDASAETLARVPELLASAVATLHEAGEVDGSWTPARIDEAIARCASLEETVAGADLVDIVPGPQTDPAVIEEMRALMEGMGQKPIVLKRFVSGYVANRIQSAISAEVFRLLDEDVASPREIDDAIIHGLSL